MAIKMAYKGSKERARRKRHLRVRKKLFGTSECPRLCVFRSLRHIYAQVIDDVNGHTLAAASTLDPELQGQIESGRNKGSARLVGKLLAQRVMERGIDKVVFDRGGYLYHGRIRALAEGAREKGLNF